MTSAEVKTEIQKSLDRVPENVLRNILALLKEAESHSTKEDALLKRLKVILDEDSQLLERLAK